MTRIEIAWPDEMTERVRAARGRLEIAGAALRAMSLEERLDGLARILESWRTPDSSWRRELVDALSQTSPLHEATVRESLEAALNAWRPERFVECARRELLGSDPSGPPQPTRLVPYAWTAIIAGGGVPMPTLLNALIPIALGSPVLMREASNDPVTGGWLRRSLEFEDERFGRAFESFGFPSEDPALEGLLEAPCVVATGSDETIRSIASRIAPERRFVAYGHQFSIAVVGSAVASDASKLRECAEGLALDVARWDQMGCLSPVVVYLVDFDQKGAERLAAAIARALEEVTQRMPRGALEIGVSAQHATERAEARMREADDRTRLFEGADFTLVLESDSRPRPAPLHRFLRLMPVESIDSLERSLRPFAGHLSNIALTGLSASEETVLRQGVEGLGVSRWTRPGRLQTPPIDWPHDGRPVFVPFARFSQTD